MPSKSGYLPSEPYEDFENCELHHARGTCVQAQDRGACLIFEHLLCARKAASVLIVLELTFKWGKWVLLEVRSRLRVMQEPSRL